MNPISYLKEHRFAEYWPPIKIYAQLLKIAVSKLNITEEEARLRYWDASIKKWCEVLQITTD